MDWAIAAIALYCAGLSSLIVRRISGSARGLVEIQNQNWISLLLNALITPIFIATATWIIIYMPWYMAGSIILISIIQPFSIHVIYRLQRSAEIKFLIQIETAASFISLVCCILLWGTWLIN